MLPSQKYENPTRSCQMYIQVKGKKTSKITSRNRQQPQFCCQIIFIC